MSSPNFVTLSLKYNPGLLNEAWKDLRAAKEAAAAVVANKDLEKEKKAASEAEAARTTGVYQSTVVRKAPEPEKPSTPVKTVKAKKALFKVNAKAAEGFAPAEQEEGKPKSKDFILLHKKSLPAGLAAKYGSTVCGRGGCGKPATIFVAKKSEIKGEPLTLENQKTGEGETAVARVRSVLPTMVSGGKALRVPGARVAKSVTDTQSFNFDVNSHADNAYNSVLQGISEQDPAIGRKVSLPELRGLSGPPVKIKAVFDDHGKEISPAVMHEPLTHGQRKYLHAQVMGENPQEGPYSSALESRLRTTIGMPSTGSVANYDDSRISPTARLSDPAESPIAHQATDLGNVVASCNSPECLAHHGIGATFEGGQVALNPHLDNTLNSSKIGYSGGSPVFISYHTSTNKPTSKVAVQNGVPVRVANPATKRGVPAMTFHPAGIHPIDAIATSNMAPVRREEFFSLTNPQLPPGQMPGAPGPQQGKPTIGRALGGRKPFIPTLGGMGTGPKAEVRNINLTSVVRPVTPDTGALGTKTTMSPAAAALKKAATPEEKKEVRNAAAEVRRRFFVNRTPGPDGVTPDDKTADNFLKSQTEPKK